MTSDIVEWLRAYTDRTTVIDIKRLDEAADEIERLRAALEDVLSYVPHGDLPLNLYDKARAAIAVVLEEAARVADAHHPGSILAREIAAAIRALIKEEP